MTSFKKKQDGSVAINRFAFNVTPIAAACAVLISASAGSAYAQQADAAKSEDANTVVVTGIRKGIEAAIDIKRNNSSIVEAISAEDIGKLPDASVAESIARLPGVTAQRSRSSGKAADVSVRGLAPSFNGSLLNGREQASTGNARAPEFDLFPAELMGSVLIYKTPDASLVGQGLAATIDLHTLQPLDFGKRVIAASYRKQRTGVQTPSEGTGDRATFSYVDQFADRTIGVALGVTKFKEDTGAQQKFDSWGGFAPTVDYNGAKVAAPGGFKADTESGKSNRDGASLTLQFKPNKNFKSSVDIFYSSGYTSQKKTGLEGAIAGSAGGYDPNGVLSNATIVNGVATSGTFSNYKGVVRNHQESADDKLTSIGWNSSLKLDEWTLDADLSHSKANKNASRFETTAGQPGDATSLGTISYTGFNGGNFNDVKYTTSLNYADRAVAKLTDVNGWGGGPNTPQAGYVALPTLNDKADAIRFTASRDLNLGPVVAAHFGLNFSDREKIRAGQEGRLVVKGGGGYASATMPGSAVGTAGTTGLPVASWDPSNSLGSIYDLAQWIDASVLAKDWSVHEKVTTAYAMGDLDGQLFGLNYKGNFGTQFVRTDQSSTGNQVDVANCTGITAATCPSKVISGGTTYSDVLPSMNVSFDIGSEQFIRLGAAKVLSRANMDDMRASNQFGVNPQGSNPILVGTGGNPNLKPFSAKSLDISYEKYFGKKGYLSVAGFYKQLDTYIYRSPTTFDFKPYVSANTPLPLTGAYKGSTVGLMTAPRNGEGGNISGFEVALNVPFSLVTPWLDGFGVMVNHSDTSSEITLPGFGFGNVAFTAVNIPLPGLSKRVSNLRLYYEKNGFQVAWAARKRSDFLGQVSDYQDNQQLTMVKGETIIDLQASYEFQTGWFKGLSVLFQANNWTNTPFQEYANDPSVITNKITYGRSYLLGANYKF
ncbi:TonB-dependent receptor [Undibacterium sp. Xuan67W]|uniref:TonB-dependent receptor n=1 Tax=Undibacterium sp. Xuan67W TaxID=3413057 RepID=UPI003BF13547